MAESNFNTKAAERVRDIENHLKDLQNASGFLFSLANYKNAFEETPAASLSPDTLFFLGSVIDMAVDTISAELGVLRYTGTDHAEAFVRMTGTESLAPSPPDPVVKKGKCPKAETEGGRVCPVCWPDVVQEDMDQLDRLGDCLQTLAATREFEARAEDLEGEVSLAVTTAQLRSWAFVCRHIALWTPEKLADAAKCQEGGAA